MSEYLIINLSVLLIPLAFSFEKKLSFYKKLPAVLVSIVTVGIIYLIWDSVSTLRNDWSFNGSYLIGIKFLHLPLEEILFFITVPYACIFIYETVNHFVKDKNLKLSKSFLISISLIFLITGIIYANQNYTFTVMLFCASVTGISAVYFIKLFNKRNFWITILITYIPFFLVNYILTSLPIVTYNSTAIWGIRILTIPLEDFFYSYSMIGFWLIFYHMANIYFELLRKKSKKSDFQ